MAFFDFFALLLAAAFLILACRPQHVRATARHRKAFKLYLGFLVLFYPVSNIFHIGIYLSIFCNPIAMILSILSFRHLWLSLSSPAVDAEPQPASMT